MIEDIVKSFADEFCFEVSEVDGSFVIESNDGKAIISKDGKVESDTKHIKNGLEKAIARGDGNLPVARSKGVIPQSGAVSAVQALQKGKSLTYKVSGQQAPTSTAVKWAAGDLGITFEVTYERHGDFKDYIVAKVKATDKNRRYSEAVVDVWKQDFVNTLAWKMVQDWEDNGVFVLGDPIATENGFPNILPDATVKVRVNSNEGSFVKDRRAIVEVFKKCADQWVFQGRQVQTKAKRNAALDLIVSSKLPVETMDREELEDEKLEVDLVNKK